MGFWSRRITNVAALMGGSGAQALLAAETDGLAIDFTDASLLVRDTTTTSNAWTQLNGDVQTFWRDRSFTSYASPSPKITRDSSGTWTFRPHNLLVMSERMQSAAWTATSLTVTDNTVANPLDGATTAATLALVDASATHQHAATAIAFVTTHRYTFSVYAKANTHGFLQLAFPTGSSTFSANSYANFNLSTGATSAGADATATATDVGNGWYRCSITSTATASATTAPLIVLVSAIGAARAETHDPNSTNSVYAYGAMVNVGPAALTYTKTAAHNLCLQSQTFDNASWTNGETTETANSVAAPDGTTTADTLTAAASIAAHNISQSITAPVASTNYTLSVYAKQGTNRYLSLAPNDGVAHGVGILVDLQDGTILSTAISVGSTYVYVSSSSTSVGNGWYRLAITFTNNAAANIKAQFELRPNSSSTGWGAGWSAAGTETVYLWGAQIELASSPGKYVATTAAAVYESRYELPREWDSAGACQGLLVEEARTNICLYASDLTNAAWTKSNMTTALTATGPDGVANTATTCTATAGNATALQAITSGNAARITSMFVKRRTGTGDIDLTQDNGTTWSTKTVTSSWTRVEIASVTSTNPTVGIRIVTSGDAVDIALFQHEVGAFITSPIYTGSASVTRAGDMPGLATSGVFPFSTTAGSVIWKGSLSSASSDTHIWNLSDVSINERFIAFESSGNIKLLVADGGVTQAFLSGAAVVADTLTKYGSAWAANDFAHVADGGAAQTDASGTLPTVTTLKLGAREGDNAGCLRIKQFLYVPRRMTNNELQAATT
jgi:hypothetical protein